MLPTFLQDHVTQGALNCTPSELCTYLQAVEEGSLPTFSLATVLSVPSRLTPTVNPCSCNGSETVSSPGSQSSVTSESLTDAPGEVSSMSSQAASRVSPGVSRAPTKEPTTTATSGPIPFGWFAKYDPATSTWRMSQGSLLTLISDAYSGTWPKHGMMRAGVCWELSTLVRLTSGNASGYWPTIRSPDGDCGGRGDLIQAVRGNPNTHYQMRPTPLSQDAQHAHATPYELTRSEEKDLLHVRVARKLWPTPDASVDHHGGRSRTVEGIHRRQATGKQLGLKDAVVLFPSQTPVQPLDHQLPLFPTPSATSYGSNQGGTAGRTGPVRPSLETMARQGMWPTPTVSESTGAGQAPQKQGGMNLRTAVELFPTPTNSMITLAEMNQARFAGNGGKRPPYETAKDWATPTTRDHRSGKASEATTARNSRPLSEQVGGSLNPTWVCWLMGWPLNWEAPGPLNLQTFRVWLVTFRSVLNGSRR